MMMLLMTILSSAYSAICASDNDLPDRTTLKQSNLRNNDLQLVASISASPLIFKLINCTGYNILAAINSIKPDQSFGALSEHHVEANKNRDINLTQLIEPQLPLNTRISLYRTPHSTDVLQFTLDPKKLPKTVTISLKKTNEMTYLIDCTVEPNS